MIVTNAKDFFRCCKDNYETALPEDGTCQHYRVFFQYLRPSDIRRHHDCNLDEAIPGTRSIYSIKNTLHPLKLKIRSVPCLCNACLLENGEECKNSHYTDAWQEVDLLPAKGDSSKKHFKQKHPKDYVSVQRISMQNVYEEEENVPDDVLPVMQIDNEAEDVIDLTGMPKNTSHSKQDGQSNLLIDLMEGATNECRPTYEIVEEGDLIIEKDSHNIRPSSTYKQCNREVEIIGYSKQNKLIPHDSTFIPNDIYRESVLGALEHCKTDIEMYAVAKEISQNMPKLRKHNKNVHFSPECDFIDAHATATLPEDAPQDVHAIWTQGDGNCMC